MHTNAYTGRGSKYYQNTGVMWKGVGERELKGRSLIMTVTITCEAI